MIELIDQMNRTVRLAHAPKRIVSLVPSQTELLSYLGCDDKVVGITKFCIHPNEWFRNKTRVGGTKNVNFEIVEALNPDLIIANKEENTKEDIEKLSESFPVYTSDIYTVADAIQMILDVGKLTDNVEPSIKLATSVELDFETLPQFEGNVLYFIWANPYMVVGPNTFIGSIMNKIGLKNLIADPCIRYQEITPDTITELNPDHILLSSEPFPFKTEHQKQLELISEAKIHFVDGELFSWYGSRMLQMKPYFEQLAKKWH